MHRVLDTVTVALKEERKHKYAAPQHAHLWPDERTINNRTESKPMRFPLQSCPAAISNGNTERLRAAPVLLLLWFSLSALLTCSISSKKCHKNSPRLSRIHSEWNKCSPDIVWPPMRWRKWQKPSCSSRQAEHITNATSGFCHDLQKQQSKN